MVCVGHRVANAPALGPPTYQKVIQALIHFVDALNHAIRLVLAASGEDNTFL